MRRSPCSTTLAEAIERGAALALPRASSLRPIGRLSIAPTRSPSITTMKLTRRRSLAAPGRRVHEQWLADNVADDAGDDLDGMLVCRDLDQPWRGAAGPGQLEVVTGEPDREDLGLDRAFDANVMGGDVIGDIVPWDKPLSDLSAPSFLVELAEMNGSSIRWPTLVSSGRSTPSAAR